MKKILIPIDSSEYSEKAVLEGKIMSEAFESEVVLVHVLGIKPTIYRYRSTIPNPQKLDAITENEVKQAEEMLEDYRNLFGEFKERVGVSVLHGSVSEEILKAINETDIDFVIMGSHGIGSALYRNLLGSVTNKVIHHSKKPVLVVR